MADIFSGDAVFTELIHQRARENEVEEQIQVRDQRALRRLLPFGAPKNGEDLDGSKQRPAAVGKPRRDCRCHALRLRAMEWHDPDGKYVQKLAQYVDEKMHEIADVTKTVDTQKVAVLAALAIADELHSMQRDLGDHDELMREQAERCLTLVERALKQTA